MKITEVPFVKHLEIETADDTHLQLTNHPVLHNHFGTLHAGALYTLAESQSALLLTTLFPTLADKVLPVLRSGGLTYKKPVTESVRASATLSDEEKERFLTHFHKKGRGSITVTVLLEDSAGTLCATGDFTWFVQRIENENDS